MADLRGHAPVVHSTASSRRASDSFQSRTATSIKDTISSNVGPQCDVLCLLPDLCPVDTLISVQKTRLEAQENNQTDVLLVSAAVSSTDEDEKQRPSDRYDSSESSDRSVYIFKTIFTIKKSYMRIWFAHDVRSLPKDGSFFSRVFCTARFCSPSFSSSLVSHLSTTIHRLWVVLKLV